MAILEVNNLKKGFGETDVLKGVSFQLKPGQVLVYDDAGRFTGDNLTIFGTDYHVAGILDEMAMQKSSFVGYNTLSVVTADMAEFSAWADFLLIGA